MQLKTRTLKLEAFMFNDGINMSIREMDINDEYISNGLYWPDQTIWTPIPATWEPVCG